MTIVVIDEQPETLASTVAVLCEAGYSALAFADPREALRNLSTETGLILSDVRMSKVDGFMLALRVAVRLGIHPPRTVLTSDLLHTEEMAACSPSVVIGLLSKPLDFDVLARVLRMLEDARTRCPGRCGPFCQHIRWAATDGNEPIRLPTPMCDTTEYASCPYYDDVCGMKLRKWIESHNSWASLPPTSLA